MSAEFVRIGDAAKKLRVSADDLRRFLHYVLHLKIKGLPTVLIASRYIDGYLDFLNEKKLTATMATAREFADSDKASSIASVICNDLTQALESRSEFTCKEAAEVFGVTASTVRDWVRRRGVGDRTANRAPRGVNLYTVPGSRLKNLFVVNLPQA